MATKSLTFTISAVDKTKAAFQSVTRSLGNVTRSIGGIKTVVVALTAGFGLMAKRALDAADDIAKTADAIGVSTTALQEFRHAAELSGVSNQQLESGLGAFTKRLGEARAGTGALTTFLGKFDQSLLDSVRAARSTDEALGLVFERLGETASASDRAALAAAAFGRTAGIDMTNLVREGAAGLDEMRQEAHRLGLILDEDLLRGAESANDALTRLGNVVTVNFQRAMLALGPVIETVATWLADVLVGAVRFASNAWGVLKDSALAAVEGIVESLQLLVEQMARLPEFLGGDIFAEWALGLAGFREEIALMRREVEVWGTASETAKASTDSLTASVQAQSAAVQSNTDKIVANTLEREKQAAAQRINARLTDRRLEKEASVVPALETVTSASEDAAARTSGAWVNATGQMGRSITSFVRQGEFDLGGFADFAVNAISQILPLLLGGGGGGGGFGGFGALFGGGRASGGPVGPGKVYRVNEQQPEFLVNPSQGRVVPLSQMGGAGGGMGGVAVTYNIDARGAAPGVGEDIRRVLREEEPGMIRRAVAASTDAVARRASAGGPYAKQLAVRAGS